MGTVFFYKHYFSLESCFVYNNISLNSNLSQSYPLKNTYCKAQWWRSYIVHVAEATHTQLSARVGG